MDSPVLFFDGVCNLCNGLVNFILKHERNNEIKFAPLQSKAAYETFKKHNIISDQQEMKSLIFIVDGKVYTRRRAALKVAGYLKQPFSFAKAFKVIPVFIADPVYDLIAKVRYKVFGKMDQCMIPDENLSKRFLP